MGSAKYIIPARSQHQRRLLGRSSGVQGRLRVPPVGEGAANKGAVLVSLTYVFWSL